MCTLFLFSLFTMLVLLLTRYPIWLHILFSALARMMMFDGTEPLPDPCDDTGTKPLPESILTYHYQMCSVVFTWKLFHKKCPWTWSMADKIAHERHLYKKTLISNLYLKVDIHIFWFIYVYRIPDENNSACAEGNGFCMDQLTSHYCDKWQMRHN